MDSVSYPDLGATVYPDDVPAGILDGLPALYNSVFSTPDWWDTHDKKQPTGVCVLEHPRHVIAFTVDGDTVEVMNKVFSINAHDARRACAALFRALPRARRIHIELLFPPRELRLPVRVRNVAVHMVIDLPATVADYDAMLGKRTRSNLRNFQNRLRRDHPDVSTSICIPGEEADRLFEQFLTWKRDWFQAHGRTTFWDERPEEIDQSKQLARRRGEAHVTRIGGAPAAIRFLLPVGDSTVSYQGAFDPAYQQYRLGLVSSYWTICNAIERGMRQINLLWSTTDYKGHLGATPRPASQVSVFRSQVARLYSLDEARNIAKRKLRQRGSRLYWQGRGSARRLLERAGVRKPKGGPEK
jgi:CelD/BcsL family acetyltransferase involved in cellulose biosynthesis